jgi:hypothetical protein
MNMSDPVHADLFAFIHLDDPAILDDQSYSAKPD